MRILIIDQCSGAKSVPDRFDPFERDEIDSSSRQELIAREQAPSLPARDLYDGRQQIFVTTAVDMLRNVEDSVDRLFVSAGFGLVDEHTLLPPYDVTFNDLSEVEIHERSEFLGIQSAILQLLEDMTLYDLVFLPLGKKYYQAIDLADVLTAMPEKTSVVLFNQEEVANEFANVLSIPAKNGEAKEHGTIVVALKGRYLLNFAEHRTHGATVECLNDVLDYCTREFAPQTDFDDYDLS